MPETRFEPGSRILWREWCPTRRRQSPEVVRPVTVVRDDADGLVAWLAPGTEVMRAVVSDGRDFRDVALPERHRLGREPKRDRWRGNGVLKIAPAGMPWSVWVFWDTDWNHLQWYVNLEAVHIRDDAGIITRDHELDVVVLPGGETVRKDEDELAAAVAAGRFTSAEARQFKVDAAAVESVVASWGTPFADGWEHWRPDPGWSVPAL